MLKLRSVAAGFALLLSARDVSSTDAPSIVDLHVDLPYQVGYRGKTWAEGSGQAATEKLDAGGVSGVVLPLFVPRDVSTRGPRLVDLEASYQRVFEALARSDHFGLPGCTSGARIRTWLAFEGASPLSTAPESLDLWVARGVRVIGLVHTEHNELASSSSDPRPATYGLSPAGRALVRRAHALRVAVDVSHASDRAVDDVLNLARETSGVVVATHSNARSLAAHPRNVTDAQIRRIARTGGVVGINFHAPFVARGRAAVLGDVVSHVLHVARIAGARHVAIGADYEGGIRPARGLEDASRFPELARALRRAGLTEQELEQVLSGNALRVLCGSSN